MYVCACVFRGRVGVGRRCGGEVLRPLVKSVFRKGIFLIFDQNICCGYSKGPSQ